MAAISVFHNRPEEYGSHSRQSLALATNHCVGCRDAGKITPGWAVEARRKHHDGERTGGALAVQMDEAGAVCGPGYVYDSLAERIRNCAVRLDAVTDQIRAVQSIDWQSPAGEAFRQCMHEDLRTVMNLRDNIIDAALEVQRLAELAALEESTKAATGAG